MTAGFYEITGTDVSMPTVRAFGRTWLVKNFMGQIFPRDVGKRVYLRGDIVQVENDEQYTRRLENAPR
jgi:hypothetical protein